jgi:hypothetical protein
MRPAAILRSVRLAGAASFWVAGAAFVAVCGLAGCDQDSYSSTDQRDTHMGDVRAAVAPPPPSASVAAAPAMAAPAASASH